LDPGILRAPLPELPLELIRDAIPGIDSPAELMLLPILLPPTILPTEFVIRGPKFPKTEEAANPGAEFRLPTFRLEDKPCPEPPIAFMLLLNPGFPPTFIPPLLLIPE
jgi:hypothetical protein